jgi:IstB-like ATP binding protein
MKKFHSNISIIGQDELNVRQRRQMERRTKAADFRGLKTLEDFDWSFNPAIHRKEIFDLPPAILSGKPRTFFFSGHPAWEKRI